MGISLVKKKGNRKINEFKLKLFSNKIKKKLIFQDLKYNYEFSEINHIFKELSQMKIYNKIFHGTTLPKKYSDLRKGEFLYYHDHPINRELFWESIVLSEYQNEINNFLKLKEKYEENLLIGNYHICKEILERIEREICVSMWSMEQKFILLELNSNDSQEEIQKFKEVINKDENDGIIYLFAEFLSRRVDVSTSSSKYSQNLNKILEDFPPMFSEYLSYKLDFFQYKYEDLKNIIFLESTSSIVDRYLTFTRVLQFKLLDPKEKNNEDFFWNLLLNVSDISDAKIQMMFRYLNPRMKVESQKIDRCFLRIADNYTIGNYEESYNASLELLQTHPNCIDLYEINLKSLIHDNKSFNNNDKNLVSSILSKMYDILVKNEKTNESTLELVKYIRLFGSNDWTIQLYYLLKENFSSKTNEGFKLFHLNSKVLSPKFTEIFSEANKGNEFLNEFNISHTSISIDFWRDYINSYINQDFSFNINENIPSLRRKLYFGKILMYKENYKEAIDLYLKIISSQSIEGANKKFFYEKIITNLYKCYLGEKKYKEAMDLFLENYLESELLTVKLNLEILVKEIKHGYDEFFDDIGLPIIIQISNSKALDDIYTYYDNFLFEWDIVKPSELVHLIDNFNRDKLIYFLKNVCTTEVMDSSYIFENSLELEKERISILQLLIEIDHENTSIYSDEISKITQKLMLKERMQQVDESKIFVDIQGIKNSIGDLIKESFKKYTSLSSSSLNYVIDLTNTDENGSNILLIKPSLSDVKFVLFKEIFLEIRDSFISSNEYGLDSYLSVRIRHGTLLGQLRSQFENFNLVTSKTDKNSEHYLDNKYWVEKLQLEENFNEEDLNYILSTFSKKIDGIISQVLQDWMHIKTDLKPGLFDFSTSETLLYTIYLHCRDLNDYNQFFDKIIEALWEITKINLKNIRDKISNELKEDFVRELTELEDNINQLKIGPGIKELNKSIVNCRTNVQHEMEKISRWFQLTKNRKDFRFTIEQLIKVCLEILNNVNPKFKLCEVNYDINDNAGNVILNGIVFPYFVDIILILLDNIILHSGWEMEGIKIDLKVYADQNNRVIFDIENNVKKEKLEEVNEKIKQIEQTIINADEHINLVSQEGGTGYPKILKILKYDIKNDFSITFPKNEEGVFKVLMSLSLIKE